MLSTRQWLNPEPPDYQSDVLQTEPPRPCFQGKTLYICLSIYTNNTMFKPKMTYLCTLIKIQHLICGTNDTKICGNNNIFTEGHCNLQDKGYFSLWDTVIVGTKDTVTYGTKDTVICGTKEITICGKKITVI